MFSLFDSKAVQRDIKLQISVTIKLVKRQFNIHTDKLREIVYSRSFYSGIIVANIKKWILPILM